jgi:tRNA (adenine57-N1/adenine58-N1)-methyltransferase
VAREEFESHGYVPPLVTVLHRDVCKLGFSMEDETSDLVDAVFLDLPHPWLAIPHAKNMIKKGRNALSCYKTIVSSNLKCFVVDFFFFFFNG